MEQLDRLLRPVGRENLTAAERCRERRETEPAAELEHFPAAELEARYMPGESEAAGPQLRPVREELLFVERRLVDQLLGARRPEDRKAQARPELDPLLDERLRQSAAKRSTGTPSGSLSCA